MLLRPFLYEETACASYLFGCLPQSALAVVDPHVELDAIPPTPPDHTAIVAADRLGVSALQP
jgi:hypothetical protein